MTAREWLKRAEKKLTDAGVPDAAFDAACLWQAVTGKDWRLFDGALGEKDILLNKLDNLLAKRAARYPLQYLVGEWEFYNISLQVGQGVLIPRADTETIVDTALSLLQGRPVPAVADLCAGSGAIGCAIAHNKKGARVRCVELSEEAFRWLVPNCARWGAEAVRGDIFTWQDVLPDASLDLLVSNPPYVTETEYAALEPELAFEPKMALVAEQEGLAFYRHITTAYKEKLKPGGALCFEIGWLQAEAIQELLRQAGYENIRCVKDLSGNDRCICGNRPADGTVK